MKLDTLIERVEKRLKHIDRWGLTKVSELHVVEKDLLELHLALLRALKAKEADTLEKK